MSSRTFAALAILGCAGTALCQTTGSIEGSTRDGSGAPMPGATIEAASTSLQGTRTAVSSADGLFRIPATPPGDYVIRATLAGYRTAEKTATVRLGKIASVDFALEPATAEEVTVLGKAPLIDTSSTTTGTSYTSKVIERLPVNRNYADIVRSNPGVDVEPFGTTDFGRTIPLTIYGATSVENQWVIDGVHTTNVAGGQQGKSLSNDFVQEIEVKTGGYQAEYGRALGGIINMVTKSGGNTFHGSAFVYYDSTGTMAQQEFLPSDQLLARMKADDGTRLDYGADLGGYLLKDYLWFFGAYNRVTLDSHVSLVRAFPHVGTDVLFPINGVDNLYSGKLTWNAAPSTTIFGTVFADPSTNSGAAGADPRAGLVFNAVRPPVSSVPSTWYSSRQQGGTDFGLHGTQLLGSNAMVTAQGSYHQDSSSLTAADEIRQEDHTCVGGTLEHRCRIDNNFPNSVIGGYGRIGTGSGSRSQADAAVLFYSGAHELKAGGDYMDGRVRFTSAWTGGQEVNVYNEHGVLYYAHNFYTASVTDPAPLPSSTSRGRVIDYSVYAQDFWRAAANLTLNVGLRWDGEQTRSYTGQTVWQDNGQWQPRVGLSWDPWRDGATKVYAFAGRYSYALPAADAAGLFFHVASLTTFNHDPISVVQDPTVPFHPTPQGGATTFSVPVDAGLKGYSQDEFLAGIERAVLPQLTVGVKGVYRRLNNVIGLRYDLDYTSPLTDYSQYAVVNPGSSGKFAQGDVPTCNGLDYPFNQCFPTGTPTRPAKRVYRGIELLARESVTDQLWIQASYIYSSLRGNTDGALGEINWDQGQEVEDFDYPALSHNAYGALFLDRPHRFRVDGFWTTPFRLSFGLQAFVESGAPTNRMGYFNGVIGPYIYLDPRGSTGRLPALWNMNMTLSYPISLGPATVTPEAFVYNVINKQIPTAKDEVWSLSESPNYPADIFDPSQPQQWPYYGKVVTRQSPRSFRAAVRVSF